jgi:serine/threonine-protein phosphatase PGAM5
MAYRTIYLIRHGQYDPEQGKDLELGGEMTPLGVEQAQLTAQKLSSYPISCIYSSSLKRSVQTAKILSGAFNGIPVEESDLLWEITPPVPYLLIKYAKEINGEQVAKDLRRMEQAFSKYFKPAGEQDDYEVVVCHGNVIRYFVCRVLNVSIYSWLNYEIFNCSISEIEIDAYGHTKLVSYNESCHFPEHLKTQNMTPMGFGLRHVEEKKEEGQNTEG